MDIVVEKRLFSTLKETMTAYPLQSQRLTIDPLIESDLDEFLTYRRNPTVARWQSWSTEYSREDALHLLWAQPPNDLPDPGGWVQMAVRSSQTGQLYGDIAIGVSAGEPDTYELGGTFDPEHQGSGFATEAAHRVITFLFDEVGAHRVTACCDSRNSGARSVLMRLGLRHESHQVESEFRKAEWTTVDGYALLAKERATLSAGR